MSQHLPTHDFSWTDEDVNFMNVPDDSEIGYIFEVDLEYPDESHDLHNCYPLAPEKIESPMCGGAPSCMKVIESRHWCSIWGATKFSSMFLYLLAVTVQVTGPLRVVSSKKKGPRMNVAVNPHQTVTFSE
ncbi:uncharacterized protein TNCV_3252641 [Trichonephila clavipes]|nr:uncharacterized protein TNCV_3252641 [Trichonephila clavipes]